MFKRSSPCYEKRRREDFRFLLFKKEKSIHFRNTLQNTVLNILFLQAYWNTPGLLLHLAGGALWLSVRLPSGEQVKNQASRAPHPSAPRWLLHTWNAFSLLRPVGFAAHQEHQVQGQHFSQMLVQWDLPGAGAGEDSSQRGTWGLPYRHHALRPGHWHASGQGCRTGFGQLEKFPVAPQRGPRAQLRGSPAPRATQDCETLQITFSHHSQNQLLPYETSVFQKSMTKPPLYCQTGLTARQSLLLSFACLSPLLRRVTIAELK